MWLAGAGGTSRPVGRVLSWQLRDLPRRLLVGADLGWMVSTVLNVSRVIAFRCALDVPRQQERGCNARELFLMFDSCDYLSPFQYGP